MQTGMTTKELIDRYECFEQAKVPYRGTTGWSSKAIHKHIGFQSWANYKSCSHKLAHYLTLEHDPRPSSFEYLEFVCTTTKGARGKIYETNDILVTRYTAYRLAMERDLSMEDIIVALLYFSSLEPTLEEFLAKVESYQEGDFIDFEEDPNSTGKFIIPKRDDPYSSGIPSRFFATEEEIDRALLNLFLDDLRYPVEYDQGIALWFYSEELELEVEVKDSDALGVPMRKKMTPSHWMHLYPEEQIRLLEIIQKRDPLSPYSEEELHEIASSFL